MENIYDLAILGAGPAGICAAIYATRAKLNTIWLDKKFVQGGQIVDTYEVDNYPGLPGITGLDLGEAMAGHAKKLGMETAAGAGSFYRGRAGNQSHLHEKK